MGIAQLVAFLVFAAMFVPAVRQMLLDLGALVIGGVALVGVIAFGIFVIRRSGRKLPLDSNPFTNLGVTPALPSTNRENKLQTTTDLIEQLRAIDWFQFEQVVAFAYRKLDYIVTRRGGANPDGGIDLVIEKDGQRSAVQCKQWKKWNVGVKTMREFLGALTDAGIQNGIFISLREPTSDASQLAAKHGIEMLNEVGLAKMLEETGARFDPEVLALLEDTQKFCPKCEHEMILRTAAKGVHTGRQFWGCSTYPRCRFTMPG